MFTNQSETYAESEAYDSASVVSIHTRSELSSDSVSAYDSASVASVASVNQPLSIKQRRKSVDLSPKSFFSTSKQLFAIHFLLATCNVYPLAIPELFAHNMGIRLLANHSLYARVGIETDCAVKRRLPRRRS